jgi:HNH endonuclease/AP2 domain
MKPSVERHTPAPSDDPSYRNLPLTRGLDAKVPTEIHDYADQWNWHATSSPRNKTFYAYRYRRKDDGPGPRHIGLHNVVYELLDRPIPFGVTVDFINRDGLDCRLGNLRLATPQQQCWNTALQSNNICRVIGVRWHANNNKWTAQASDNNGVVTNLGYFDGPISAAWAHDQFVKTNRGEFAVCSNPVDRRVRQEPLSIERRQLPHSYVAA